MSPSSSSSSFNYLTIQMIRLCFVYRTEYVHLEYQHWTWKQSDWMCALHIFYAPLLCWWFWVGLFSNRKLSPIFFLIGAVFMSNKTIDNARWLCLLTLLCDTIRFRLQLTRDVKSWREMKAKKNVMEENFKSGGVALPANKYTLISNFRM